MSLFPDMDADLARHDRVQREIATALLDRMLGRGAWAGISPWEEPKQTQKVLLTGLDCLPSQENLFPTDGGSP